MASGIGIAGLCSQDRKQECRRSVRTYASVRWWMLCWQIRSARQKYADMDAVCGILSSGQSLRARKLWTTSSITILPVLHSACPSARAIFDSGPRRADAWTMELKHAYVHREAGRDRVNELLHQADMPLHIIQSLQGGRFFASAKSVQFIETRVFHIA